VTAVDALTGEGVVFDATSDVPLARAVAASCSLPAIMPPVTIGGRPYVDGGVASEVHLDLAAEHDEVLAIVPLDLGRVHAEAASLRAAGTRVDLIVPSDAGRTAVGRNIALLDPDRRSRAARVGREDGHRAARALRPALTA
jgi:NTE family protein